MLRQQGVKLRRAQSQQPLDTATPQDTHSGHSQEHNDVERWVLRDSPGIHTDRYALPHAAVPRSTQGCRGSQKIPRDHAHTHTKTYSSRYRHPWAYIQRKPRAMGMQTEAHTFVQAQRLAKLHHGNHTQTHTIRNEEAKT